MESKESSQSTVQVTSVPQGAPSMDKKTEASSPVPAESSSDLAPESGLKILGVSNLHPQTDEWVPKQQQQQQSFQAKQASQQQIPIPPHPKTQRPMHVPPSIPTQPAYPGPGQHYIMSPQHQQMVLNSTAAAAAAAVAGQPQYNVRPKRAVVSVRPDYTASAVQATTGQPLLAQSAQPGYMQYIQHQVIPPQPTEYEMGQEKHGEKDVFGSAEME